MVRESYQRESLVHMGVASMASHLSVINTGPLFAFCLLLPKSWPISYTFLCHFVLSTVLGSSAWMDFVFKLRPESEFSIGV